MGAGGSLYIYNLPCILPDMRTIYVRPGGPPPPSVILWLRTSHNYTIEAFLRNALESRCLVFVGSVGLSFVRRKVKKPI